MPIFSLFKRILPTTKKYTLVISGGGTRGFYALGILKGLEELGYREKIKAIYGVSAGAILASYWAAGYTAQQIFDSFFTDRSFGISSINILSRKSLLKFNYIEKKFTKDLPSKITDLKIPVYIGTTDTNTGTFKLFTTGELIPILLGSISIPGIFPVVKYHNYILMDGGASNNFPVDRAKKKYPNNEIIGIALNKFKENQEIKTIFDNLSVSFEILLRNHTIENMGIVDHLFYKDIPLSVLDTNKKNMHKAYLDGYKDCMEHFKN